MIAIELSVPAGPIVQRALEQGLRINGTQQTVLRLLPALTISNDEVDEAFDILARTLNQTESELVNP